MIGIEENVDIAPLTSFCIGGKALYFAKLESEDGIPEALAFAQEKSVPFHVLGEGSNTIFKNEMTEALVCKMEIRHFHIEKEDAENSWIRIGAGENWDECVRKTVEMELSGIEAMSAIPGTTGATPVQNVGAYGQEIKDTLVRVRAYDTELSEFVTLSNAECNFSYRKSIFNTTERSRYIITSILLKLSKLPPKVPDYPGVAKYFEEKNIQHPSLLQIREAIMDIRRTKLPDPKVIPNAGSFFGNPIVPQKQFQELQKKFPDVPNFPVGESLVKIPAGWLIEQAGFKGKKIGPIQVYEKNALVLTNTGEAKWRDLEKAKKNIVEAVEEKFGIGLRQEPEVV